MAAAESRRGLGGRRSQDARIVVTAEGDGAIHWRRADDGSELLALQVLPNRTDWVMWTPEGFYEATPGAQDVLKWVTNHGPDRAASTLPVSAIPNSIDRTRCRSCSRSSRPPARSASPT